MIFLKVSLHSGPLLHQGVEVPCLGVLYLEYILSTWLQTRYSPTDLSPARGHIPPCRQGIQNLCPLCLPSFFYHPPTCLILSGGQPESRYQHGCWWHWEALGGTSPEPRALNKWLSIDMLSAGMTRDTVYLHAEQNSNQPVFQRQRGRAAGPTD